MDLPNFNYDSFYRLEDDFFTLDTVKWASVDDSGTGTNTANDVNGGQVSIVTAAAANDYHLMSSTKKNFQFLAGKPVLFEAEFSCTEAATNQANLCMGLTSVTTTGFMATANGGPPSSFSGAMFYKTGGGMSLGFITSNGSAQKNNTSLFTLVSGNTYRVGFRFQPLDTTQALITPYVYDVTNGVYVNTDGKSSTGLSHKILLSGLAAMNVAYGVVAGSSAAETLKMNRIDAVAAR